MTEDDFEKFKKVWEEQIRKIENEVLDTRGVQLMYLNFHRDKLNLLRFTPYSGPRREVLLEIDLLESKLSRALEIARTKYIIQSRSLWVKIIESIAGAIMAIRGPPKS